MHSPALEIAAHCRRHSPATQNGTAPRTEKNEGDHQTRRLEYARTSRKTSGFLRVWSWLRSFGRKRPAMAVAASSSCARPDELAGKNFAIAARVLGMDASLSDSLKTKYCEEFERYYALTGSGEADLSGVACQLVGHIRGMAIVQPDLQDETMRERLKLVEPEIWRELKCTATNKLAAQMWLSDNFKGSLPSPDARQKLRNFTAREKKTRNEEVTGPSKSLFAQLGFSRKLLAACHRRFDEDIAYRLFHEFLACHSQNPTGDVVEMVLQAYETAMDSLIQIAPGYPTEALEVFKSAYLNSFKERYRMLSDFGKNPVNSDAFWFDHAKALAHGADMAVSVAYSKSNIYKGDLYLFRRDLQAIFCDINLALLAHKDLKAFRQTMPSGLFGLSDAAPRLKRGQRFALHSRAGIR